VVRLIVLIALANATPGRTQTQKHTAASPAFEVASVRLAVRRVNAEGFSFSDVKIASPGRLAGTNASLDECIRWAYDVKEYQVSGPDWIKSGPSYDIEAKAPPDTSPGQMRLMLQTLLRERFKLKLHSEVKPLPVYFLNVGKNGLHLQHAISDAKPGLTSYGGSAGVRVVGESATMESLAHRLSLDLDRPVFDKTGIKGAFQISLEWAREGDGPSVFGALQDVGLKLAPSRAPAEFLIVDRAEKIPAEN